MTRLRNLNRATARGRVLGTPHTGVVGSLIPSAGAHGPSFLYNDLSLPADADKEICGRITTWPAAGTLFAYEDGSFNYSRTGDGADSFQYQLYVDGVSVGAPQSVNLNIGSGAATATGATLTGTAQIIAGTATGGGSSAVSGDAPGAVLQGGATIQPGSATGQTSAAAPGCELTGLSTINAGTAIAITFARAPAGAGYSPRSAVRSVRPRATQRTYR